MDNSKIERGQKIVEKLIQKAWEDASFKEQLVNNPKATIENLIGQKTSFGENKTLVVEDQTDSSKIYLNIPAKVNLNDLELSEDQLELVAGGDQGDDYLGQFVYDVVAVSVFITVDTALSIWDWATE
ncbi:NHLP leader peptide family RiPP precursor [uncultured Dokdonia sp.]|uniref:NHLP leader peptide family RiPP precursor n=1 Tax=uncultured Dokdonia sp. TaxID=575653 RepID=UPI00261C1769|nr:NHLP leader peptide family RiPP precursor [uncultured Dokdonia sp.]